MEWAGKGLRGAEQRKRNGRTEMGERGRLCHRVCSVLLVAVVFPWNGCHLLC